MYNNVSPAFARKIAEYSRTFRAKMVFEDGTVVDDRINGLTISGGSNMGDELKIGNTPCCTVDVSILFQNGNYNGKSFELFMGLMLDDKSIEYIPYGKYIVISCTEKNNLTKITAADYMNILDVEYKSKLSYPNYATSIFEEIKEMSGIEYDIPDIDNLIVAYAPRNKTMRDMVGLIAGLAGKIAIFDRQGVLRFKWYEDSGYSTDLNTTDNPEVTEEEFKVNFLSVKITDNVTETVGDENAVQGISIDNEYATPDTINNAYKQIRGFSYRGCKFKLVLGDIRIDSWDVITVNLANGQQVKTIPMIMSLKFDGGVSINFTAKIPNRDTAKSPAQIQSDKQATASADNALVVSSANTYNEIIRPTHNKIVDLFFYTRQQNFPFLLATIQFVNSQQGNIQIDMLIDGAAYKTFFYTFVGENNIVSFTEPIKDLVGGSHRVELFIKGSYAEIPPRSATIILTGMGLLNVSSWNGLVNIEERMSPVMVSDYLTFPLDVDSNINFIMQNPEIYRISDKMTTFRAFNHSLPVERIADNIYVEVIDNE